MLYNQLGLNKNIPNENRKARTSKQRYLKTFKTDFLPSKGVPYHTLRYGRFLPKHPVHNSYVKYSIKTFETICASIHGNINLAK